MIEPITDRICLDCPASIADRHPNAVRCAACQRRYRSTRKLTPKARQQTRESRRKRRQDPAKAERMRENSRKWHRKARKDPETRARLNAANEAARLQRMQDSDYREQQNKKSRDRQRNRYHADPEYRERRKARAREQDRLQRQRMRERLFEQQNGKCGLCQRPITDLAKTHIDHITAIAQGGSEEEWNLHLAHARCNLRKYATRTHLI